MEDVKSKEWASDSAYGHGSGDGDGSGSGFGSGSGDGAISAFCGTPVYLIDGIQTLIARIHGNIAMGSILNGDFTVTPCYIAKQNGRYAHGETLREAMAALRDKLFQDMSEGERLAAFVDAFAPGEKYPAMEYYEWHHKLTGSCEMGRKSFAEGHGIDLDSDQYTPEEFIHLCENAYGGDVIRKLKEYYPVSGRRSQ